MLLALLFWLFWGWLVAFHAPEPPEKIEEAIARRGQIGDAFGTINSLFTAMVLAGTVYSLWLQRREVIRISTQQALMVDNENRAAVLTAQTAVIQARQGLLQAKMDMARWAFDLAMKTSDKKLSDEMQRHMNKFGSAGSKDMDQLEALVKSLETMITELNGSASAEHSR